MLVLKRKAGEKILIGDDIIITVLDNRGDGVRIGIEAPKDRRILRDEVLRAVEDANASASTSDATTEEQLRLLPTSRVT